MSNKLYALKSLILAHFPRKSTKIGTFFDNLREMVYVIMPENKGRYDFSLLSGSNPLNLKELQNAVHEKV